MKKVIVFPKILGFYSYLDNLDQEIRQSFLEELFLLNENYFEDLEDILERELVKNWKNVLLTEEKHYILKDNFFKASEMRENRYFHEAIEYYKVYLNRDVVWNYQEVKEYIIEVSDEGCEWITQTLSDREK